MNHIHIILKEVTRAKLRRPLLNMILIKWRKNGLVTPTPDICLSHWYSKPQQFIITPGWMSNYLPSRMWGEITFPFPNSNGATVEVWELISIFIPHVQNSLHWRHNEPDGVSNYQPRQCLLNCLFMCRSKKTSKLLVTGLCAENSPGTGEFPAQKASNAEMFPFDDVIMYLSTLGLKLVRVSKRDIYYDSFYTHRNGNLFILTISLSLNVPGLWKLWNVILTKLLSLAEVVIFTTSGAVSDESFVKMPTCPFLKYTTRTLSGGIKSGSAISRQS